MKPLAYYNEHDESAAEWLLNVMQAGLIPYGVIDTRSILDVQPEDLDGFTQCHFFAGIGGWGFAARLAGWPDARELWTGSCPCQPFSAAGKREGAADERHLWPDFLRLIRARRPAVVMGEQVAGALGYGWFDGVRADLAGEDFASRTVDIPALAVNAPHERNRLYWAARNEGACGSPMADAHGRLGDGRAEEPLGRSERRAPAWWSDARGGAVGDPEGIRGGPGLRQAGPLGDGALASDADGPRREVAVGDAIGSGLEGLGGHGDRAGGRAQPPRPATPANGRDFWRDAGWRICHDGKARRAEPGSPLLVDGVRGRVLVPRPAGCPPSAFPGEEARWVSRVGAWKGAGNAIVPQEAAEVIAAYRDVYPDNYEGLPEAI